MDEGEILARIAAVRAKITTNVAELDELLAQLGGERGGRPRLTLVRGSTHASSRRASRAAAIRRQRRRAFGFIVASTLAVALGAMVGLAGPAGADHVRAIESSGAIALSASCMMEATRSGARVVCQT